MDPPETKTFDKEHLPKHLLCLPAIFSIIAFLLSLNGLFCTFVAFTSPTTQDANGSPLTLHFGYWSHQSWNVTTSPNGTTELQDICQPFPYDMTPPDETFKVGRTFNMLALIFGASFLFMDILTGCSSTNQNKTIRQASGWGYILTSFCSGMSLLIFQSTVCTNNQLMNQIPAFEGVSSCTLYNGSKCVIAATVLWFASALGIMAMHPWSKKNKVSATKNLGEPLLETIDEEQIMTATL